MSAYEEIKESYHQKVIGNLRTFEQAVSKATQELATAQAGKRKPAGGASPPPPVPRRRGGRGPVRSVLS
ncbi:MAG: hypothetical protein SPK00_11065 [Corynebacterium glucuronolyticum]|nr:hypothetical protein [Corynebacterium glucuronolyticum]MDD7585514.1 hypothetical protein [Mycobacteriaceae bacterium]MDY5835262.1 hypothetical protein [Corynebacterium glucuronolyticum]